MNRFVEERCFKSGMDDIMAKPMNLKTLQKMLAEHDRRRVKHNEGGASSKVGSNNIHSPAQQSVSPVNRRIEILKL